MSETEKAKPADDAAATAAPIVKPIDLTKLTPVQVRVHMSRETVKDYAEKLASLPPIIVFHQEGSDTYYIADGCHRYEAATDLGHKTMRCEVRPGGKRDALLYAATANAKHGLPLTRADKRHIVKTFLEDKEWSKKSDRWIAKASATSNTFVSELRKELEAASTVNVDSRERETSNGRIINTAKIGKTPASTKPPAPPATVDPLPVDDAPEAAPPTLETDKPWSLQKRDDGWWFADPDGTVIGPYATEDEAGDAITGLMRTVEDTADGEDPLEDDMPDDWEISPFRLTRKDPVVWSVSFPDAEAPRPSNIVGFFNSKADAVEALRRLKLGWRADDVQSALAGLLKLLALVQQHDAATAWGCQSFEALCDDIGVSVAMVEDIIRIGREGTDDR